LSDVRTQESQPTGAPPSTSSSYHQVTSGSPSAGQPQLEQLRELSIIPDHATSEVGEEDFQEPPGTGETQTVSLHHSHTHLSGSSGGSSSVVQPSPSQIPTTTGTPGREQSTLGIRGGSPSPERSRSITPTQRDLRNAATSSEVSGLPPRDPRGGRVGQTRPGKERRLEQYSDEEETGPDVAMEDHASSSPHRQQYGEACFTSLPTFPCSHP